MRRLLEVGLLFLCGLALSNCTSDKQQSPSITITSWGGSYQETEKKAFFEPFQAQSGIKVNEDTYSWEYGRIESMVKSGQVMWDVVEVETPFLLKASKLNLLTPINYSVVSREKFLPGAADSFGIAVASWAEVLCWNSELFPKSSGTPSQWADLWDTKKYPGKRAFEKRPQYTLEVALLADGVPASSLYPLDIERALRKLDAIRNEIVWWSSGAELQTLMTNTCILGAGWNGRIWSLMKSGKPVGLTMNQALLDYTWWVVPRGAKNAQAAMKFLESTARPEASMIIAKEHGYGSVLVGTEDPSDTVLAKVLPTSSLNRTHVVPFNAEWWVANEAVVTSKWDVWFNK